MISFKQYIILKESLITWSGDERISPKVLLLKDSLSDLPEVKPYGFWVDGSGNYKDVYMTGTNNNGGHAGVAGAIIKAALDYKIHKDTLTPEEEDRFTDALKPGKFGGVYNVLLSSSFMHVVLAGNTYYYKTATGGLTTGQKKFLNKLTETYGTPIEYASEIF
jgi:hypothetical protein